MEQFQKAFEQPPTETRDPAGMERCDEVFRQVTWWRVSYADVDMTSNHHILFYF